MHQAETDETLERMILEVNHVYRAELAGAPAAARQAGRLKEASKQRAGRDRRRGNMTNKDSSTGGLLRGRRVAPGLIIGAVVVAVMVTCLGAVVLAGLFRGAGYSGVGSSANDGSYSYAPPGLVEREAIVEPAPPAPMEPGETGSRPALVATLPAGQPQDRLIIRTGSITVRVEDTLDAQQEVENLVARLAGEGAYVVSSEQRGGGDGQDPYISMSIRVPAARFGEAMDAIADLAVDVASRTESADDVTEEYVDLAARLEALEAARDRLLEIMSEANRTEDLLAAEEQLTRREAEIEAIKGRMQYLSQSAALARIWVEFQPYALSQPVGQRWRPAETVREALEALLAGAQGLVDFAIFVSIAVLPWLLALALGLYVLYRIVRWAMRRRQGQHAAADTDPGA